MGTPFMDQTKFMASINHCQPSPTHPTHPTNPTHPPTHQPHVVFEGFDYGMLSVTAQPPYPQAFNMLPVPPPTALLERQGVWIIVRFNNDHHGLGQFSIVIIMVITIFDSDGFGKQWIDDGSSLVVAGQ